VDILNTTIDFNVVLIASIATAVDVFDDINSYALSVFFLNLVV